MRSCFSSPSGHHITRLVLAVLGVLYLLWSGPAALMSPGRSTKYIERLERPERVMKLYLWCLPSCSIPTPFWKGSSSERLGPVKYPLWVTHWPLYTPPMGARASGTLGKRPSGTSGAVSQRRGYNRGLPQVALKRSRLLGIPVTRKPRGAPRGGPGACPVNSRDCDYYPDR